MPTCFARVDNLSTDRRLLADYRVVILAVEEGIARYIEVARELKNELGKFLINPFQKKSVTLAMYRPFCKAHVYFDNKFNSMVYQMPQIFSEPGMENVVICLEAPGGKADFSALITNTLPDLHLFGASQCFSLWTYDTSLSAAQSEFFQRTRRENISDAILQKFRERYGTLTKEDIFYYVYGILHSPCYKTRFAPDLKKQLPRIPMVDDFWAFSKAGRALAELHLNYETGKMYPLTEQTVGGGTCPPTYHVTKMRFPSKTDKSVIIYNNHLHLAGIPAEAYRYVVNGRSAIEWIMERYQISTHKDSGIVNDPNDWCKEQGNDRYIVDLIKRVVHLSVESVKIIEGLPEVVF